MPHASRRYTSVRRRSDRASAGIWVFDGHSGTLSGQAPGRESQYRTPDPMHSQWFGGFGTNAFAGDGDSREFSPDLTGPNSSYRMSAVSNARMGGGDFPAIFTHDERAAISFNRYSIAQHVIGGMESECSISNERYGLNIGEGGVGNRASFHMSGNDDAVLDIDMFPFNAIAWDIDKSVEWRTSWSSDRMPNGTTMNITGKIVGDGFPAAESFVYDDFGNGIMLGVYAAPPDEWGPEPEMRLAGENRRDMITYSVDIVVQDGAFTGVWDGRRIVPIDEWNKQFTRQSTRTPN